ncbi:MAG: hypothetical protein ABH859_07840 [Pseudomonadota bacterium]
MFGANDLTYNALRLAEAINEAGPYLTEGLTSQPIPTETNTFTQHSPLPLYPRRRRELIEASIIRLLPELDAGNRLRYGPALYALTNTVERNLNSLSRNTPGLVVTNRMLLDSVNFIIHRALSNHRIQEGQALRIFFEQNPETRRTIRDRLATEGLGNSRTEFLRNFWQGQLRTLARN